MKIEIARAHAKAWYDEFRRNLQDSREGDLPQTREEWDRFDALAVDDLARHIADACTGLLAIKLARLVEVNGPVYKVRAGDDVLAVQQGPTTIQLPTNPDTGRCVAVKVHGGAEERPTYIDGGGWLIFGPLWSGEGTRTLLLNKSYTTVKLTFRWVERPTDCMFVGEWAAEVSG